VLPVIKEATAKERAMMGSRAGVGVGSLKRKRDPDVEEWNINEYFFAKFLTSPDLIDLEVGPSYCPRNRSTDAPLDCRHTLPSPIPFPALDTS
jgi:hypothetical protein